MKGKLRLALPGSNAHSVFECLSSLLGDSPGISAGGRRCRGEPPPVPPSLILGSPLFFYWVSHSFLLGSISVFSKCAPCFLVRSPVLSMGFPFSFGWFPVLFSRGPVFSYRVPLCFFIGFTSILLLSSHLSSIRSPFVFLLGPFVLF